MQKLFGRRAKSGPPDASRLPPAGLQVRREALLARLEGLDERAKRTQGYRSALTLLNRKFRQARIPAKLGVLQAAQFMVEVLERLPLT